MSLKNWGATTIPSSVPPLVLSSSPLFSSLSVVVDVVVSVVELAVSEVLVELSDVAVEVSDVLLVVSVVAVEVSEVELVVSVVLVVVSVVSVEISVTTLGLIVKDKVASIGFPYNPTVLTVSITSPGLNALSVPLGWISTAVGGTADHSRLGWSTFLPDSSKN